MLELTMITIRNLNFKCRNSFAYMIRQARVFIVTALTSARRVIVDINVDASLQTSNVIFLLAKRR